MRRELKFRLLMVGQVTFIVLLLGEVGVRVATHSSLSGMPSVGRYPLLPWRPTAAQVSTWWDTTGASNYVVRDSELGWTVAPNGVGQDPRYAANSQGVRTRPDRVFDPALPSDKTRIVVLGDSLTHGTFVALDDTWAMQLESLRPDWQVLNFGVPGYGTDQAFLRWRRDASKFKAHVVILGIWPDDVFRNLNVLRFYLAPEEGFASKPRFELEGDRLVLHHVPTPSRDELVRALTSPSDSSLARDDYWYHEGEQSFPAWYHARLLRTLATIYDLYQRQQEKQRLLSGEEKAGITITAAIARQFATEVRQAGSVPLVMLVPMRNLLKAYPAENSMPLVQELRRQGIQVIDIGPTFSAHEASEGAARYFLPNDHLTPAGNRLLAETLAQKLQTYLPKP